MEWQSAEPEYEFNNFRNQIYAVFSANSIMFSYGCIVGWVAPALILLTSDETPLKTGPITLEQLSLIGSMNSIGAIFGIFTFGYITSFIGCKRAMLFLGIPSVCYWLFIMFGDTVHYIIFARWLIGLTGGGIYLVPMLYTAEIADDKIRGALGSIGQLCRNVGVLTAFVLGALLDYDVLPYLYTIIPVVYMINFNFLPNTPQYLVRNGEYEEAEKALMYYKGCRGSTVAEVNAISKELYRMKVMANERLADKKWHFSDIYERSAIRALSVAIVLSILSQFSGSYIFMTYSGDLLSRTGNSVNPYTASIIFGVIQIAASLFTTQLADRLGRRVLLTISLCGTVLGQMALSIFTYLHMLDYDVSLLSWIPVISMSFVVFISTLGIIPLAPVCTVEVLPAKIRTVGMLIHILSMNISSFLASLYFPILSETIGLYGCLMITTGVCMLGILFVIFVMEETNGINLDSIGKSRPGIIASSPNNNI